MPVRLRGKPAGCAGRPLLAVAPEFHRAQLGAVLRKQLRTAVQAQHCLAPRCRARAQRLRTCFVPPP
eukprot:4002172-Karenia_brevis.AAC.1